MKIVNTAIVSTLLASAPALAGPCDAYFTFDGNLQDSGGNGYHGVTINTEGGGGAGKVSYVDGRFGQALKLDGTAAMRALMDLHYDACPQVTITAWVQFTGSEAKGAQYLVSTGGGSGPGVRLSGSTMVLNGTANGISRQKGIRPNAGWTFVAGVYDYAKKEYTLYVRARSDTKKLSDNVRPPEDSLWVGAFNDKGSYAAKEFLVDDLRIYGRALSAEDIATVRTGGQVANASSCAFPDVCFQPANSALTAQPVPGIDPNMARAGAALPGGDPNFARAGSALPEGQAQIPLSGTLPSSEGLGDSPAQYQSVGGLPMMETDPAMVEAMQERLDENAPPELGYASEEEALAAAEERAAREEAERAAAEATAAEAEAPATAIPTLQYDAAILVHSGVTGGAGDYTKRFVYTESQGFPFWLETRENYDKPCTVYVHSHDQRSNRAGLPPAVMEYDVCEEGLPRLNPFTTLRRVLNNPQAGDYRLITALQVCNNGINNRVKGIRAQVRTAEYPSGNHSTNYDTVVFQERANCVSWKPLVKCNANTFAVGVTLHFRDGDAVSPRDFLSGIELACASVHWEDLPPLGGMTGG